MPRYERLDFIPRRALAVSAHPDDAELNAGATLAKWIAAGCEVTLAVCTDGAAGTAELEMSSGSIAEARRGEQQAAAHRLGVHSVVMLGLPDGGLEDTVEFRGRIVELIRRYRPDTVLTHDSWRHREFSHRDHRIAGTVVRDSIYPYARDRLHYPEQIHQGLQPHKVEQLLLWESDEPGIVVDVSGYIDIQAAALRCHQTQLPGLPCGPDPKSWLLQRAAAVAQGESFEAGETFRRLLAP
jgi:LmbE family N-acetylglucosaminyl deacetylase